MTTQMANLRENKGPSHIPVLDGLRGLAIALVMLQHFFQHGAQGDSFLDRVSFALASRGWCGVDLFFVLSGFLITGILYDAKQRPHYFRNFYARRTLRIFPLYYFVLFFFFVLLPSVPHQPFRDYVADSSGDQIWFWSYLSNFRMAAVGAWYENLVPNVFWSLAIEEQFYLVWPLVVLLCGRRTLMTLCGLLFLGALAVRMGLALEGTARVTSFVLTPARMDGLAAGAFLALLARGGGLMRAAPWAWVIGGASLAGLLWLGLGRDDDLGREFALSNTLRFTVLCLIFASLMILTLTGSPRNLLRRAFELRVMRVLGKYSYALYLWHGPLALLTLEIYRPNRAPLVGGSAMPRMLVYIALAASLSLLVAWLSWHLLEKHFLRLKDHFRGVPAVPPQAIRPPADSRSDVSETPRPIVASHAPRPLPADDS